MTPLSQTTHFLHASQNKVTALPATNIYMYNVFTFYIIIKSRPKMKGVAFHPEGRRFICIAAETALLFPSSGYGRLDL